MSSTTEALHRKGARLGPATPPGDTVRWLLAEEALAVRAVQRVASRLASAASTISTALARGGRLIYLGAGTSGRLATLDAAECGPTFGASPRQILAIMAGGSRALRRSIEGAEDDRRTGGVALRRLGVSAADVVVGVSASGRTPFVLTALAVARELGAATVLLSCNPTQARRVKGSLVIAADTGAELVAGSTRLKAGTATKLMLNALSTAAMTRLGRVDGGRMVALRANNEKLAARAVAILVERAGVDRRIAARALGSAGGDVARALRDLKSTRFGSAARERRRLQTR